MPHNCLYIQREVYIEHLKVVHRLPDRLRKTSYIPTDGRSRLFSFYFMLKSNSMNSIAIPFCIHNFVAAKMRARQRSGCLLEHVLMAPPTFTALQPHSNTFSNTPDCHSHIHIRRHTCTHPKHSDCISITALDRPRLIFVSVCI